MSQDTIYLEQLGDLISKEIEVEEGWGRRQQVGWKGQPLGSRPFINPSGTFQEWRNLHFDLPQCSQTNRFFPLQFLVAVAHVC